MRRRRLKSPLVRRAAVLALAFCAALPALAWAAEGHRIAARVANEVMDKDTKQKMLDILDQRGLIGVATHPDEWRIDDPDSAVWHFVSIPLTADGYDQERDCQRAHSEVGRQCAVAAVEHFTRILADRQMPKEKRARALIFLVHIITDIHQPFHTADNNDRGATALRLQFYDKPTSLHAVWDSGMISRATRSRAWQTLADDLVRRLPRPANDASTPVDWVNASHALARRAYIHDSSASLGEEYYRKHMPDVERQLFTAGVRVAALFERVLGTEPD